MKTLIAFVLASLSLAAQSYDVVVYGGTPGGIATAVTAARLGHSVALVEYHRHLGGMSSSGLGKSDIHTREAIGGLFREFVGRIYDYYVDKYGAGSEDVKLCRDGYYYEAVGGRGSVRQDGGRAALRLGSQVSRARRGDS